MRRCPSAMADARSHAFITAQRQAQACRFQLLYDILHGILFMCSAQGLSFGWHQLGPRHGAAPNTYCAGVRGCVPLCTKCARHSRAAYLPVLARPRVNHLPPKSSKPSRRPESAWVVLRLSARTPFLQPPAPPHSSRRPFGFRSEHVGHSQCVVLPARRTIVSSGRSASTRAILGNLVQSCVISGAISGNLG